MQDCHIFRCISISITYLGQYLYQAYASCKALWVYSELQMLCSFDWCMCLFGWVFGWVMWIALHELDWWQNRDLERFLLHCGVGLSYLFFPFIFEESLKLSLKAKRHVTTFNVWFFKYIHILFQIWVCPHLQQRQHGMTKI